MAKASESGRVKTRLVPPLTSNEASKLNTCFLADVSANILEVAQQRPIDGYIAYASTGSEAFFTRNLPAGMMLLPPREAGLGRSLRHAMADLLAAGYAGVCLVNSDSPTLPAGILKKVAAILLESKDRIVLGPCEDGGYYLIGLRALHERLFEDISWSTDLVLAQTLERAAEIGLDAILLPKWYDVDDATTLVRLRDEMAGTRRPPPDLEPYRAPNTRSYLASTDAPQFLRMRA
jgi:rSAM/selenodomain-associated transferase 1